MRYFLGLVLVLTATVAAIPPDWTGDQAERQQQQLPEGGAFDTFGVKILSQLNPNDMDAFSFSGNDCWGYVSPSGREYALMGLDSATAFVEITDPANPVVLASIADNTSTWSDIKIYGEFAYNVNETGTNGDGIQIFDLTQIDSGIVTLVQEFHGEDIQEAHNVVVDEDSGFLYAVGARTSTGSLYGGGLVAYDLTDPANPVFVGAWSGNYLHDAQVITYDSGPYAGMQIAFGFAGGTGMVVVDVTDKANMNLLSLSTYPSQVYCHQGWVSTDRRFVYINDEIDENNGLVNLTRTIVFDISDLSAPQFVGAFSTGLNTSDHNLYTRGDLIFEVNYKSGLRVFDARDPISPVEIGYLDTYPLNDTPGYDGAWSSFPYFPSGTIIVSDMDFGLFVAQLTALRFGYPGGQPSIVTPNVATPLVVHVDEYSSPVVPASVTLHTFVDGGAETLIAGVDLGGNDFAFDLPATACGGFVDYYVSADNGEGEVFVSPRGAPGERFRAGVAALTVVVFTDDFSSDNGWTVSSDTCVGTPFFGGWERVVPNGTTYAPAVDSGDAGDVCFVTGQGIAGGNDADSDVDGGPVRLVSPTVATSGLDAKVEYTRWFFDSDFNADRDSLTVEVSTDGGTIWQPVETTLSTGAQWVDHSFLVSEVTPPGASVTLRFTTGDCPNNTLTEAAVDDVRVTVLACADDGIPTVSQWGLAVIGMLLLIAGTIVFARSRAIA